MRRALVFCVGAVCMLSMHCRSWPAAEPDAGGADARSPFEQTNPLGVNAACYVCHMTFVREDLSKTHLQAKVGCIRCHDISAGHANDEDIGATPPDVSFKRDGVDRMCRKCHKSHDIAAAQVVSRWLELDLHEQPPICTDCHDTHRINRAAEDKGKANARLEKSFRDKNDVDGSVVLEYPIGVEL